MLSKSLEETLRRAMTNASSLKHEFATLEHLLSALLKDQDAIEVLKACSVNVKILEEDIDRYLKEELKAIVTSDKEADTQPTAGFQRVVQRAVIHTQSSGRSEATGANIFFVKDEELHTPIADCFLDGITRQTIITIARENGIRVHEKRIKLEDLKQYNECFVTGTAAEVTPVNQIEEFSFTPGIICKDLIKKYSLLTNPND